MGSATTSEFDYRLRVIISRRTIRDPNHREQGSNLVIWVT